MGRPRSVDYDEVRAMHATGDWTRQQLAEHFGVSVMPINRALNPDIVEYQRRYQLEHPRRVPCPNGCGRMSSGLAGKPYSTARGSGIRKGLCLECATEARRTAPHGSEARYHRGCRCDDCRAASTAAKASWRARNPEKQRAYDRERKRRERQAA